MTRVACSLPVSLSPWAQSLRPVSGSLKTTQNPLRPSDCAICFANSSQRVKSCADSRLSRPPSHISQTITAVVLEIENRMFQRSNMPSAPCFPHTTYNSVILSTHTRASHWSLLSLVTLDLSCAQSCETAVTAVTTAIFTFQLYVCTPRYIRITISDSAFAIRCRSAISEYCRVSPMCGDVR